MKTVAGALIAGLLLALPAHAWEVGEFKHGMPRTEVMTALKTWNFDKSLPVGDDGLFVYDLPGNPAGRRFLFTFCNDKLVALEQPAPGARLERLLPRRGRRGVSGRVRQGAHALGPAPAVRAPPALRAHARAGRAAHVAARTFELTVHADDATLFGEEGRSYQSIRPVRSGARHIVRRELSVQAMANLPDNSYTLWDWASGNEICPADRGNADALTATTTRPTSAG